LFWPGLLTALLFGPDCAGWLCADAAVAASNPMQTNRSERFIVLSRVSGTLVTARHRFGSSTCDVKCLSLDANYSRAVTIIGRDRRPFSAVAKASGSRFRDSGTQLQAERCRRSIYLEEEQTCHAGCHR
jgi:hypothetical protein